MMDVPLSHIARVCRDIARDHVKQCCLARTIRADQPHNLALLDANRTRIQGLNASNALGDVLRSKDVHSAILPRPLNLTLASSG